MQRGKVAFAYKSLAFGCRRISACARSPKANRPVFQLSLRRERPYADFVQSSVASAGSYLFADSPTCGHCRLQPGGRFVRGVCPCRSEEHTSELQSPCNLVCRLLLEKKK